MKGTRAIESDVVAVLNLQSKQRIDALRDNGHILYRIASQWRVCGLAVFVVKMMWGVR